MVRRSVAFPDDADRYIEESATPTQRDSSLADPLTNGCVSPCYAFALRAYSPSSLAFRLCVLGSLVPLVLLQPFDGVVHYRLFFDWRSRVAGRTSRHRPGVSRYCPPHLVGFFHGLGLPSLLLAHSLFR